MNIDLGRCMQKRISFLRFNDQIIPFGLWLMRVICQLPMISYKPLMTGRAFQHLFTSFGLSSFYEHGMRLSAFWTVFKMELVHLPVGLDKITDHLRNTIFLVSTELIGDARKKIVGFKVN